MLQWFFPGAVADEREPPNRVDKQRLRPARLRPEPPVPVPHHLPLQARRRIQFAGPLSVIYGSAVGRTARSLSTQSGRCVRAQHALTESPLRVENVLSVLVWTLLRDGVPPLLLKK